MRRNLKTTNNIKGRFIKHTKNDGDCVVWTGAKTNHGYGRFMLNGKSRLAHRVSAWLAGKLVDIEWSGNWKGSDFICHSCDNPSCVNPDHLYIGTHEENMKDRFTKFGHHDCAGINNPNAKRSREDVLKIRSMFADGIKPSQISKMLGFSLSTVEQIAYNKTFKGEDYALER